MYLDSNTTETDDYNTPIACDNIARNAIELDADSNDHDFYILRLEPVKRNVLLCLLLLKI